MADGQLKSILCYVSLAGNNKIADWYDDLSAQGKADADEFIKNMRKTDEWKMPDYRSRLKGYKKLGELRWTSEKTEQRLVGYLKGGTFYAVVGCTHKGKVYNPADALNQADKRKDQIESGAARAVPYDL
jgi:hypothetical protein